MPNKKNLSNIDSSAKEEAGTQTSAKRKKAKASKTRKDNEPENDDQPLADGNPKPEIDGERSEKMGIKAGLVTKL